MASDAVADDAVADGVQNSQEHSQMQVPLENRQQLQRSWIWIPWNVLSR